MLTLYDHFSSGNGYKVRLLLKQLGVPFERVGMDLDGGEMRTPEYLAKNPNGKIPALELESGEVLSESDAILFYLAEGTPFLPEGRIEKARVLQWMFFEQYSHEPAIAVARNILHHTAEDDARRASFPDLQARGHQALGVMERHLEGGDYFVGETYTIADIALYAYTHVAGEGGFDLGGYRAIRAWLVRVAGRPNHRAITES